MQQSNIPAKLEIPFANGAGGGYIRVIPTPSQPGGAASLTDGFPPPNFVPVSAGGIPPFGEDVNGILNVVSAWARWMSAGGPIGYDSTLQSTWGGYPKGCVVQSATTFGTFWVSTVDDNLSNPDTGGAGWVTLSSLLSPQKWTHIADVTAVAGQTRANFLGIPQTPYSDLLFLNSNIVGATAYNLTPQFSTDNGSTWNGSIDWVNASPRSCLVFAYTLAVATAIGAQGTNGISGPYESQIAVAGPVNAISMFATSGTFAGTEVFSLYAR